MTQPHLHQTDYDKGGCEIGVVHLGYGAFHRAHQAVYLDDYMQATGDLGWGIAAVNLRGSESEVFAQAAANKQGYLLKTIAPDGTKSYRLVRSHVAFEDWAQDAQAALALISKPSVKCISVTVTESGYAFKDDWSLDTTEPQIAAELAGAPGQTVYAFLTEALSKRAESIGEPVTILICDNIRSNGKVVGDALLSYMEAKDRPDLAAWVRKNVTFPCAMVDRITPRATPELQAEISQIFPEFADTAIHAETFVQWVLEDKFAALMPALGKAGVEVVPDVEPYEEAKIRILNGGHTGLTYFGALGGHTTFDKAMTDPKLRIFFDRWELDNVLPGLDESIPFDTKDYLGEIADRFMNPGIADQLERICMDGYSKMAIYVRPTLEACLEKGISPEAGYDCVASWVVYARQHKAGSTPIPYHEPLWDKLEPMIAHGSEHDLASEPQIWGDLPQRYENFVPNLVAAIKRMDQQWQA